MRPDVVYSTPNKCCAYEDIASGRKKGVTAALVPLLHDLDSVLKWKVHTEALFDHVDKVIADIEARCGRKIAKICFGKTTCAARKDTRVSPETALNSWNLTAYASRWNSDYKNEGYDGLIGVATVVREHAPRRENNRPFVDQENYALALEGALIHRYMLEMCDERVTNKGVTTGSVCSSLKGFGVVYMAFKLADKPSTADDTSEKEEVRDESGKGDDTSAKEEVHDEPAKGDDTDAHEANSS